MRRKTPVLEDLEALEMNTVDPDSTTYEEALALDFEIELIGNNQTATIIVC